MAQTQTNTNVQFHSISKANYDELETTETGALYFIKDNGEIRKGDKHITGARVYTATDPAGTSAVSSLTINLGNVVVVNAGTPDTTKELPKKGDTLLVEQYLSKKNEDYWELNGEEVDPPSNTTEPPPGYVKNTRKVLDSNGTKGYSAYIYKADGGTYSASGWQACCENVDASKVILTEDITMAGSYSSIGNFNKGNAATNKADFLEGGNTTSGVSVYELIKQMLQKTVNPTVKSTPSASGTASYSPSGKQEVGTSVTATYTFSLTDGKFTNGKGTDINAGCSVDNSEGKGYHVTNGVDSTSNSGQFTFIAGTTASKTVSATIDYTASSAVPTDNFDTPVSSVNIPAGTTGSKSVTLSVNSYRKWFYLVLGNSDMVDAATDNTKIESGYLRQNGHGAEATLASSLSAFDAFQQVLIFLPKSTYSSKKLAAETAKGLPYTVSNGGNALTREVTIAGAGNDAGVAYSIWEIKLGSPSQGADTIKLAWS